MFAVSEEALAVQSSRRMLGGGGRAVENLKMFHFCVRDSEGGM